MVIKTASDMHVQCNIFSRNRKRIVPHLTEMYIIHIYAWDSKTWQSRIRGNNRAHVIQLHTVIKRLSDQIIGSTRVEITGLEI